MSRSVHTNKPLTRNRGHLVGQRHNGSGQLVEAVYFRARFRFGTDYGFAEADQQMLYV